MIKAVAGGGGRGMRAAHNEVSLVQGLSTARGTEAEKAFGNAESLHREADRESAPHRISDHGRQPWQHRASRRTRLLDPAAQPEGDRRMPVAVADAALRKKMGNAAVKLAESVGYQNAGTMEFLVDQRQALLLHRNEHRIQVEHTITEEVYGCDLVKEQIQHRRGREALAARRRDRKPACTPSNAGSTPRIRRNNFQPVAGRDRSSTTRRADAAFGSIRMPTLATPCRRTTTR